MNSNPGADVEVTGIYWCTVCKTPAAFDQGTVFPTCPNLCSKCRWHLVKSSQAEEKGVAG